MNFAAKAIGAVAVVGVIIGGSLWLGRQNALEGGETVTPANGGAQESAGTGPGSRPKSGENPTKPVPLAGESNKNIANPAATAATGSAATELITDWNEQIDAALTGGGEDREVAQKMLKLFPRFPPEGQAEAIQHIANLLPDEDYAELSKLATDAKLPEPVLEELMMDLLNRPNKIMLPTLLEMAKQPAHPKAGEAKDFLELYLEEDYGADWNLWQTKVNDWLKANPD
jgi:hypothetical protein